MTTTPPITANELDELLTVLANQYCRTTLAYFRDSPEEHASVSDIAAEVRKQSHGGMDHARLQLHHVTLPCLADVGVVEYDARSRTVRYLGDPKLESLLERLADC